MPSDLWSRQVTNTQFPTFANSFTNWLLPWLALIAQLPYEAEHWPDNAMSGLLAVGSPMLITYSLMITILNRSWIRREFKDLKAQSRLNAVKQKYNGFSETIVNIQYVLQEIQQAPIRLSQAGGWLSGLILLPGNQGWWKGAQDCLARTRRGATYSLFAQISAAVVAWLFTIISAFIGNLGDLETALQISSNSLWVWMIPIISGWILVGTQSRAGAIRDALSAPARRHAAYSKSLPAVEEAAEPRQSSPTSMKEEHAIMIQSIPAKTMEDHDSIQPLMIPTLAARDIGTNLIGWSHHLPPKEEQQAVMSRCGLNPRHPEQREQRMQDPTDDVRMSNSKAEFETGIHRRAFDDARTPEWLGFTVVGDEQLEGPLYNYARVFMSDHNTHVVKLALQEVLAKLQDETANCRGEPWEFRRRPPDPKLDPNFIADARHIADFCGLGTKWIPAYQEWSDIGTHVKQRMIISSLVATGIQWGTTGAGLVIAYLTPTTGLGCRSGGYLIYGVLCTVAWLLLVLSSLISRTVMFRYQVIHQRNPAIVLGNVRDYKRTWSHRVLCMLAVTTRLLGKSIAALNAIWLVLMSIFEYTGVFANCWCSCDYWRQRENGWVVLFKDKAQLAATVEGYWIGGIVFSISVSMLA